MKKNKAIFLGTNGWYDTQTGNTISVLIDAPEGYIILDAGNGIYKADRYIKRNKPVYLFLSHFHLDHVVGLHVLAKFKFKQGLTIVLQKGQRKLFNRLVNRDFTASLDMLPTRVKLVEKNPRFVEAALDLSHPVPCFGLRLKLGGKIISYIADTGPCANADRLAKGSDLLISECAFKPGQVVEQWPHLDPITAAGIARRAGAKRLVLAHFDAEVYASFKERKTAERQARKIFPGTRAATDDLEVTI